MNLIISAKKFKDKAELLASRLGHEIFLFDIKNFTENEKFIFSNTNLVGDSVIIYYELWPDPNGSLLELLLILDILQSRRIKIKNLIIPFIPYLRQDKEIKATTSIGARFVSKVLGFFMAESIITLDMHSANATSFFNNINNVSPAKIFATKLRKLEKEISNFTVLSPDLGSYIRAEELGKNMNIEFDCHEKTRVDDKVNVSKIKKITTSGVIIVDDMIDSGKTIIAVLDRFDSNHKKIYVCVSHILNSESLNKIKERYANVGFIKIDYEDFLNEAIEVINY